MVRDQSMSDAPDLEVSSPKNESFRYDNVAESGSSPTITAQVARKGTGHPNKLSKVENRSLVYRKRLQAGTADLFHPRHPTSTTDNRLFRIVFPRHLSPSFAGWRVLFYWLLLHESADVPSDPLLFTPTSRPSVGSVFPPCPSSSLLCTIRSNYAASETSHVERPVSPPPLLYGRQILAPSTTPP